jgi:hypothetical protein
MRGECEAAEGGVLSFRCSIVRGDVSHFLWGGSTVREVPKVSRIRRFPVGGTLGTRRRGGDRGATGGWKRWRETAGVGIGERGMVQSDQRRGASETGTVPTARVHHKEPFEGPFRIRLQNR